MSAYFILFCIFSMKFGNKHTMLKKGIYENIISQKVEREIQEAESQQLVCLREQIDVAESPKILADYLAKAIRQKLEDTEELHDRMTLVNRILSEYGLMDEVKIVDTSNLLMEVMTHQKSLLQKHSHSETVRPQSGFRVSNLFTGGSSILSLGEEIRREIASADEIYFIVSFLKLSGVRLLLDDLKKFGQREGTRLRIITTTYCGATETKAVQQLAELPHTEIPFLIKPTLSVSMLRRISLCVIPACILPISVRPICQSLHRPTGWNGTCV